MESSKLFDNLAGKIGQLRYPRTEIDRNFIIKSLDDLNSLNYRYPIVTNTTKAILLINQCCTIIPPDDSFAVPKCCQLFIQLIKKQNVYVEGTTLILSVKWCMQALKSLPGPISVDIFNVIEALLRNNAHNLTVLLDNVIDTCSVHIKLSGNVAYEEELCFSSLQCIQACTDMLPESMVNNVEKLVNSFERCAKIFIAFLSVNKPSGTSLLYHKMLEVCLLGIQNIVQLHPDHLQKELQIILGIVKTYMLYNIPNIDFLSVTSLTPSTLSLPELPNASSREKTGGKVTKQRKPIPSSSNSKKQRDKHKKNESSHDTKHTGYVPASQSLEYNSDSGLGCPGYNSRLKTSDSDFSDGEASYTTSLNRSYGKIRQAALNLLYQTIKHTRKSVMFPYWTHFIPESLSSGKHNLISCVLKDVTVRGRMSALNALLLLLTSSKLYLIQAECSEKSSSFTPFSVVLGLSLVELHRSLCVALCQVSMPVLALVLKCLAALIQATPYQRMDSGLVTKIIKNVRNLIYHRDASVQVTALIVMGCILAYEPVIPEVQQAMTRSDKEPSHVLTNSNESSEASLNTDTDFDYAQFSSEEEGDDVETGELPWLLQRCLKNLGVTSYTDISDKETTQIVPSPVRLESLQILSVMSRNYFEPLMLPHLNLITKALELCFLTNIVDVKLHAARAVEFLGLAIGQLAETPSSCLNFWLCLLSGSFASSVQNEQYPLLRAAGCDCLGSIGPSIFQQLPRDKQILCITLLFACAKDEENTVRGAAVRALALCVLFPSLREDPGFVYDTAQSILATLSDPNLTVRIKASWSLANLSDALVLNSRSPPQPEDQLPDDVLYQLFQESFKMSRECEKIKTNVSRAFGNLLQLMDETLLGQQRFRSATEQTINALVESCMTSGNMKVRWNACYALGNGLKNPNLFEKLDVNVWQQKVFTSLSDLVIKYKNFKVRINAALALASPQARSHYGNFFIPIWDALLKALENSQHMDNFTEYNHRDNLVEQICLSLGHLTTLLTRKDLLALENVLSLYYDPFKMHMHRVLERVVPEKSTKLSSAACVLDSLGNSCDGHTEQVVIKELKSIFSPSLL